MKGRRRDGPVVVLTYAFAGADRLGSLLAEHPELACTSGTGLIPLCDQALFTWRQAEGRDGPSSALALSSVRALAGSVIVPLLARSGKKRWCEIATAPPACAESFLRVYPDTQFICLHRNCADVIGSVVQANPWDLTGREFGGFAAAYPGNTVAALAAYWAARTGPLLEFEASHVGACHRVRYEDLAAEPDLTRSQVNTFLDLDAEGADAEGADADAEDCDAEDASAADAVAEDAVAEDAVAEVPVDRLPLSLKSEVDGLLTRLSYPKFG